jgi:hypothetical protein
MRRNSQVELTALVQRCNSALARGRHGGLASLQAYREAGAALCALKELVPHGQFGPIASQQCGCSKQWRARLMSLDHDWANVEAALHWAEERGRQLGAKAYSVDGALALAKEWRRARSGDAHTVKRSPRSAKARLESVLRENAALRDKLSAAQAYIAGLEAQLATFKSRVRATCPEDPDERTQDRVQKVAALWHRGGTQGERASAVNQLFTIAGRLGCDLPTLLRDCGVESPADWTNSPAE